MRYRESLDCELPDAPVAAAEYEGRDPAGANQAQLELRRVGSSSRSAPTPRRIEGITRAELAHLHA